MNKNSLREFAIESRNDLIERIKIKLNLYFVEEKFSSEQNGDMYILSNDKHVLNLTKDEYSKRELLLKRINEIGIERVVEEAAYTWFNRFIAIRYMELHDFLPLGKNNESLGIRVLSSNDNTPNPEILKFSNLMNNQLDINFDQALYSTLNNDNEKFKYLLNLVCSKLKKVFPEVFDGVTDYIDLLMPENLLSDTGFITKMLKSVDIEDFKEVEIIGWLYQYYISEKKDEVFSDLKKNIKIKKENVPAATQLFTPEWVVEYLVQNSLGNYYTNPDELEYFIKSENSHDKENIENVKFIDPCCGSGHILVYAFDLFYKIYLSLGYSKNDICSKILNNNLYGIDIDDRACQLSNLSLLLKAREYDKNLFSKNINLSVISIKESNNIEQYEIDDISDEDIKSEILKLKELYIDAKEYGSILKGDIVDGKKIMNYLNNNNNIFINQLTPKIIKLLKQNEMLINKYNCVVTNPPYMGAKGMSPLLTNYVKKFFPDSKSDMFAVFIEKSRELCVEGGYYGMITQPSILFLSSFEKLRDKIINEQTISSVLHMGRGIFGVDFGSAAFIIKNERNEEFIGDYFKLHNRTFQYIDLNDIEKLFLSSKDNMNFTYNFSKYNSDAVTTDENEAIENVESKLHYKMSQKKFLSIPGHPISFSLEESIYEMFDNKKINDYGNAKFGMSCGDGDKYVRNWYEVDFKNICINATNEEEYIKYGKKWNVLDKGGQYRKWYGNKTNIVLWENNGYEIKNNPKSAVRSPQFFFKKHISWPLISSVGFNARLFEEGYILDTASNCLYYNEDVNYKYLLGFLNSNVCNEIIKILNPTMNFSCGVIGEIPVIESDNIEIDNLVQECIDISKEDWNNYEISWDYKGNQVVEYHKNCDVSLEKCVKELIKANNNQIDKLYNNELKINKYFSSLYNIKVDDNVDKNRLNIQSRVEKNYIEELISYFIGCTFGRYSLDEEGLICTNCNIDINRYSLFKPDLDNIIPFIDNSITYFDDDVYNKFKEFIKIAFSKKEFDVNMNYIADILGRKGIESYDEAIKRYFDNDFYSYHCNMYKDTKGAKLPIYWMISSGKKNAFKCLVYSHRYEKSLLSKIRVNYLHKIQDAYNRIKEDLTVKLNNENLNVGERKEYQNKLNDIISKIDECNQFDEKIGHLANQMIEIDLDDGVKNNYEKFSDILEKK